MFGYAPGQLLGQDIHALLHLAPAIDGDPGSNRLHITDLIGRQTELRLRHEDRSYRWVDVSATNLLDDPVVRAVLVTVRDITARKDWEASLTFQALHDPLTALPNRLLLQQRLQEALGTAGTPEAPVAMLLLDLDHFKEVNDTLGHQAGDTLLQHVSLRLQETMRTGDTIGRLGGDEFAAILPAADRSTAIALAGRLIDALEVPFLVADQCLVIGASIGIALSPDHGHNPELLLKHADVAMYQARRARLRIMVYEAQSDPHSLKRLELTRDLRQAIPAGQLMLYYQPKVDLATDQLQGVEALLRWLHPVHGFVTPEQCVLLAEEAGLLDALTDWVLDTAARQCTTWAAGGRIIPVAVNISPRAVQDRTFPDRIAALLKHHDLPPERLTLEITEGSIIADPGQARRVLSRRTAQ